MRATMSLIALFACGVLSVISLDSTSSLVGVLPGVTAKSQGLGSGLSEKVRSYWQFYVPICYPL